ncbi:MAG: hypothetical protein K8T89_07620 [Planctomycetes bacterium]|nr:hypothetical protein [Planctomycetota bacterium]
MVSDIKELNRNLAEQINLEALANRQSPFAGKFVGIANGQVVTTADSLDKAISLLLAKKPDRQKTFCFEAGVDYSEVQEIWETC